MNRAVAGWKSWGVLYPTKVQILQRHASLVRTLHVARVEVVLPKHFPEKEKNHVHVNINSKMTIFVISSYGVSCLARILRVQFLQFIDYTRKT